MKKKKIYKYFILLILFPILLNSCSDDDDNWDNRVGSIKIENATDNVLSVLIDFDTLVKVSYIPENAIDATDYQLKYTSSDPTVFQVNDSGMIKGIAPGEAVLTVEAVNNPIIKSMCMVKVAYPIYLVEEINIPKEFKEHTMAVGKTFDLGVYVTVNPKHASNQELLYESSDTSIATVDQIGVVTSHTLGTATITVKAQDGSGVMASTSINVKTPDYISLDRLAWVVSTSHPFVSDAKVNGSPKSLIDANNTTCLSLYKPGKGTTPAKDEVYFIIDLGKEISFDFFRLRHRTDITSKNLRVQEVTISGSNDGETFSEIQMNIPIAFDEKEIDVTVDLDVVSTYRYFKMTYNKWHASGYTMQISEFNIGSIDYK